MKSMRKKDQSEMIVKASCPSRSGIVSGMTEFMSEHGCYISELSHFDDAVRGRLYMRCRFFSENGTHDLDGLKDNFPKVANNFDMDWMIASMDTPIRTVIMVSKYDHCLDNLLYRLRKGEINIEITAVVSNHLTLRPMVEREGIRFIYLPITKENKAEKEQELMHIYESTGSDLIILARYMQILSDEFCSKLPGKIINIHHSFLPGFKGAKPYHQAYERGVKLIGATAHYVTADLDEGPIISQSIQSVDHTYSPELFAAVGRDSETQSLAEAVKMHAEHRVFLDDNKTVVFK